MLGPQRRRDRPRLPQRQGRLLGDGDRALGVEHALVAAEQRDVDGQLAGLQADRLQRQLLALARRQVAEGAFNSIPLQVLQAGRQQHA